MAPPDAPPPAGDSSGNSEPDNDLLNNPEYRLYRGLPVDPAASSLLAPLGSSIVPLIPELVQQARQLLSTRSTEDAILIASVSMDQVTAEAAEVSKAGKGAGVPIAGIRSDATPGDLLLRALQDDPGLEAALSLVGVSKARPSECFAGVAWWFARLAHTVTQVSPNNAAAGSRPAETVSPRLVKNVWEATLKLSVNHVRWAADALAQARWCRRVEVSLPEDMVTADEADFAVGLQRLLEQHAVTERSSQTTQAIHTRHEKKTRPLQAMVLAHYERAWRAAIARGRSTPDIALAIFNRYGQPKPDTIGAYIKKYEAEPPLTLEQEAVRAWVVQEFSVRSFISELQVKQVARELVGSLAERVPPHLTAAVSGDNAAFYSVYRLLLWMLIGYPLELTPPMRPTTTFDGSAS